MYMTRTAHCTICHEPLTWDAAEGAWITPDGYDVCPTDRMTHDPVDTDGASLPLYG